MVFTLVKCGFFLMCPQETGIFWVEISEIDVESASLIKIAVQGLVMLIAFIFLIPTRYFQIYMILYFIIIVIHIREYLIFSNFSHIFDIFHK